MTGIILVPMLTYITRHLIHLPRLFIEEGSSARGCIFLVITTFDLEVELLTRLVDLTVLI